MDIREHYITSFFFHVILLLLAAALMRSHMGSSDVFSVLLSAGSFGKSSKPAQNKVEISPKADEPVQQTSSENTATDEAANPREEKKPVEQKAEPVSANDKISDEAPPAVSGMPGSSQDAAWLTTHRPALL